MPEHIFAIFQSKYRSASHGVGSCYDPTALYSIYRIDVKASIRDCGRAMRAERRDSSRDRRARVGTALCFPPYPSFWSGPVMPFRCPWCQRERTRRSKTRGFFEAFLAELSVRPFRCHDCDYRFFPHSV